LRHDPYRSWRLRSGPAGAGQHGARRQYRRRRDRQIKDDWWNGAAEDWHSAVQGLTPLDAVGRYEVLARAPELDLCLIAKAEGKVESKIGLTLIAGDDLTSAPKLDILCVPSRITQTGTIPHL
jgi:hypothetical protein